MSADKTSIAETAELFGVSLRTLRFYEQRGLIRPDRVGAVRIYTEQARIRLKLIQTGKRLGLSLSQIDALICETRDGLGSRKLDNAPHDSIIDLLTRDDIQKQLQILERQRNDLEEAITELKVVAGACPPEDDPSSGGR